VSGGGNGEGMGEGGSELEIAVVGMACRFPGADGVEAFWQNLCDGVESISFLGEDELLKAGVGREALRDPAYVRAAAVLSSIDLFDARFFGYTAREAQVLDPQQRLFLETAWEALERAGYDPERHRGAIGVFGGTSSSSYAFAVMASPQLRAAVSPYQVMLSNEKDFLATRVAYKLNLRGPAVVVQAACSTSLVAVHLACQSLLAGECDMALAGGVSVSVPHRVGYYHEPDGILSRDGHCRAFDTEASGTLKGNGVGIVVLKRLAEALRDGDTILAVIKGSATNNDGGQKVGFTAPGVSGQAEVVRAALAMAGVAAEEIAYVEAHGTATALGDPIEVAALTQAFRATTERRGFCAMGSVKTNFGHLDAAAGIAGFMKAVLMLERRQFVPSLHFREPNPRLELSSSPFYVATRHQAWASEGRPRRAGVSSFGMGGTNVHVVLEEPPLLPLRELPVRPEVLVLSARTESALEHGTAALAAHLRSHPELALADAAFTLGAGRRAFPHRRALVVRDQGEAVRLLEERDPQRVFRGLAEEGRSVAFLFSGQGAQHVNMARGVYGTQPEFRAEVDACCDRLLPLLGLDLRRLLFPSEEEAVAAGARLTETRFTQPALFTIEYALARLWMSWGVVPAAMIGHSVGEYVAACLAGVLERDEALGLVAERGRLMEDCPPGAMTAVALAAETVLPLLDGRLDLCVVNGPDACVVGGAFEDIERLEARLKELDVAHGRVLTSHAFHSRLMEPALDAFAARVARARMKEPRIPFVSNRTGTWITAEQATDSAYWAGHLRDTVRFSEGLATLLADPKRTLLEVGPGHTLVALAKRRHSAVIALASLPHPRQPEADEVFFLQTAARLWTAGIAVDWSSRDHYRGQRRVVLPTYAFDRERYWVDATSPGPAQPEMGRPGGASKLPVERWLYTPSWKRTEALPLDRETVEGRWCVLLPEEGALGSALVAGLRARGASVTVVRPGPRFAWGEAGECTLPPGQRGAYEQLLDDLAAKGGVPDRFVHLWSAQGGAGDPLERGLLSVLHLGQALGRRQDRETSLLVVTAGVQDVLGNEPLSPLAATVLGPCRVIPQEYPLLACRTLDLPRGGPDEPSREVLAEVVLAEGASSSPEPTVAYRGRHRWVLSFEPVEPAATAPTAAPLRPRGVYLVTGGLGKVGLALAAHLARTAKARLVLTSRSGLPERAQWEQRLAAAPPGDEEARKIRAVQDLEALGAEVLALSADAADLGQMRAVLGLARERFGRLHGVIHAAAELGPGAFRPLAETERADCERQLRPKLGGAEVLERLLGDESLDFVLFTSSLSTVLGGLGLGAYAAGNHALDAFARRQHQKGKRFWVSVCWDGWQLGSGIVEGGGRLASTAISAEEGGEAFARLLTLGSPPQIVVSTTPLGTRLAEWTRREVPGGAGAASSSPEAERHARPEMSAVYVTPEDPVDRQLATLWAQMLGIDRVGADDNFFELGGSSLLAVHLMGRVRKEFPVELSVATLFEAPTVRALGHLIRSRQGPDHALALSEGRGQQRREGHRPKRRTSDAVVD
jgi:phthiocerol/phenolphthiocerol synthesis type-I polyketide synthase E